MSKHKCETHMQCDETSAASNAVRCGYNWLEAVDENVGMHLEVWWSHEEQQDQIWEGISGAMLCTNRQIFGVNGARISARSARQKCRDAGLGIGNRGRHLEPDRT